MTEKLEAALQTLLLECGFTMIDVYVPDERPDDGGEVEAILVAKDEATLRTACISYLANMDESPKS